MARSDPHEQHLLEWDESIVGDLVLPARGPRFVHGQVEVVTAHPIDRAMENAAGQMEFERATTTA
jgi:hypothetical protein